jgi:hypothetical protein
MRQIKNHGRMVPKRTPTILQRAGKLLGQQYPQTAWLERQEVAFHLARRDLRHIEGRPVIVHSEFHTISGNCHAYFDVHISVAAVSHNVSQYFFCAKLKRKDSFGGKTLPVGDLIEPTRRRYDLAHTSGEAATFIG